MGWRYGVLLLEWIRREVNDFWASITVEPVMFSFYIGVSLIWGAEVQTDLMIWKVCNIGLGHNESVCDSLHEEANDSVEDEVQKSVNHFKIYGGFISAIPGLVYSIFAGALSDKYGRKPLLYLPLTGHLIASVLQILHYFFIRELPMFFFHFDRLYYIMGGDALYYMGTYSIGSDTSDDSGRATRLGRLDGAELIGLLIGTSLSPVVKRHWGNLGNYWCQTALVGFTVIYLRFFVKESKGQNKDEQSTDQDPEAEKKESKVQKYIATPAKLFMATITKRRSGNIRAYIYILLVVYTMFWLAIPIWDVKYLLMLKMFPGFDGTQYAHLSVFEQFVGIIGMLVLLPLLGQVLKLHETSIGFMIAICVTAGNVASAFIIHPWPDFYITRMFSSLGYCQFAVIRALSTKLVSNDEVGKIFSAVAIISVVAPTISGPLMKKLYNVMLPIFPPSLLLLVGSLHGVTIVLYLILWLRRAEIKNFNENNRNPISGLTLAGVATTDD